MKKQTIAYFLLIMLLSQSCVVYEKTPVTLDQAHDMGRGRLIRHNGDTLKFYNINLADSVYYVKMRDRVKNTEGTYDWIDSQEVINQSMVKSIYLNNQKFKEKEFVINEADIESIYIYKRTLSHLLTFGIISSIVVIGMPATILFVAIFSGG